MKEEIKIRKATPSDTEDFVNLVELASEDLYPSLFGKKYKKVLTEMFMQKGNTGSYDKTYFLTVKNRIAGMIHLVTWEQYLEEGRATDMLHLRYLKFRLFKVLFYLAFMPRWFGENEESELYITYAAIYPEFQGRGLGNELMKHAIKIAEKNSSKYLSLDADLKNSTAISLYKKFGMDIIKEVKFNKLFGDVEGLCRMRKEL